MVILREQTLGALLDIRSLVRHPVWRHAGPDQGRGRGVLLVPGFGFGDFALAVTAAWLKARGYRPAGARIGLNVGCTTDLVRRLEARLERHADKTGHRVILFGQSRGGGLARLLAAERPELVRGLVMLGSPVLDPLGAHPGVVRTARLLARLAGLGVPGLLTLDCLAGACFRTSAAALVEPLEVPVVSVSSRCDRVAPWELCQDPYAECVEVRSSHTGMGFDPDVYVALEPRLAGWAGRHMGHMAGPSGSRYASPRTA